MFITLFAVLLVLWLLARISHRASHGANAAAANRFFIGCRFPLLLIPELSGRNRPSNSQKTVWGAFSVVWESISGAPPQALCRGLSLEVILEVGCFASAA